MGDSDLSQAQSADLELRMGAWVCNCLEPGLYEESNVESVSHAYRMELRVQFRVGVVTSMS